MRELTVREMNVVSGGGETITIEASRTLDSFVANGTVFFSVSMGEDGDSMISTINGNQFEFDVLGPGIYSFSMNGEGLGCFVIR